MADSVSVLVGVSTANMKITVMILSFRTEAWANSADPDQTIPRGAVWSGSTLFAIPSASFGLISLW